MTEHSAPMANKTMPSPSHSRASERPDLPRLNPPSTKPVYYNSIASSPSANQSQRYHGETSDTDLTPPTSSSGLSSQERVVFPGQKQNRNENHQIPLTTFEGVRFDAARVLKPRTSGPSPDASGGHAIHNVASKRTSSGQLKSSNGPVQESIHHDAVLLSPHTRGSSVASNGSHMTELSDQLRTRLSYAMMKVQNGWESNTLDEIESLASQRESPDSNPAASAPGSKGPQIQSPRTVMTARRRRQSRGSMSLDYQGGPSDIRLNNERSSIMSPNGSMKPALAPPADIVPSTRRRRHDSSQTKQNKHSAVESPSQIKHKDRSASLHAAMEADAVETLLFLASPNNSGRHHHNSAGFGSSSQISPLKSEFASHEYPAYPSKRVTFTGVPNIAPTSVKLATRREEIDRMIDEMSDSDTEERLEQIHCRP